MCGNIRVDVCGRGVEVRDLRRSVWKCVAVCVSRVGDVWVSGGVRRMGGRVCRGY